MMNTNVITISGIEIELVRKDIKNIHLGVYPPDGRVRVAAPKEIKIDNLRAYILTKLGWIKKHKKKFASQEREAIREYVSGESHYLWGKQYRLQVYRSKKSKVEIKNKRLIELYIQNPEDTSKKEKLMKEWYRQKLKKEIPVVLAKWQKKIGVTVDSWDVRQMKTRWGSCHPVKKKIMINLELIKKPHICLEYVMVHEILHIIESSHNHIFLGLMDRYMPDWRLYKEQLNRIPLSNNNRRPTKS